MVNVLPHPAVGQVNITSLFLRIPDVLAVDVLPTDVRVIDGVGLAISCSLSGIAFPVAPARACTKVDSFKLTPNARDSVLGPTKFSLHGT